MLLWDRIKLGTDTIDGAKFILSKLLSDNKDRLNHTKQVYKNVRNLLKYVNLSEFKEKECKIVSLLHDIGYADELKGYNFHPVDAYLFLSDSDWDKRICNLVLSHTEAKELAVLKGRQDVLHFYKNSLSEVDKELLNILTVADMHASPKGRYVSYQERLNDIGERYGFKGVEYDHAKNICNKVEFQRLSILMSSCVS